VELPVVNHPDYEAKIGDDNKFPIKKFGELANFLKKEKVVNKFYTPEPCSIETLKEVHSEDYILKIKNKTLEETLIKKIGFPLVDSVVRRSLVATGGTVLASKLAINYGIACNSAGGSHHATFNEGAGYCVFNDVAVAAKYLLNRGLANKILIVDLDVHQGNGNSEIFKNENNVFTFSMHTKVNYPPIKSKSDLDVELKQNMEDNEYLDILDKNLIYLNNYNFDFVFYIAGVDIHLDDRLGKLKISEQGINQRDDMVIKNFFDKRVPICGVLGGGYNKDFKKLIELHASLHKTCSEYLNDKK
tara:strand:- start:192 stop:1097 length:906 start_codon:yes stop_codon:yes gene_type:complete